MHVSRGAGSMVVPVLSRDTDGVPVLVGKCRCGSRWRMRDPFMEVPIKNHGMQETQVCEQTDGGKIVT